MRRARRSVVVVLALAALAALASCAPRAKQPERRELVFWQSLPPGAVDRLVAEFEREHGGLRVRVEQVSPECGHERLLAALQAGQPPDLCQIGSSWMPVLLAGGRLADWSAGVADLRPRLHGWELCSVGEAIYGVPWVLETRALFYNRTLFARARLDSTRPPGTWDQLARAAAALQRLGRGVHGYGVPSGERAMLARQALPYLFANGGSILSDDARRAVFDSAANVRAVEFLLGLRRSGTMGRQRTLEREFLEGRLGLVLAGADLVGRIATEAPGLRYGVAPVPRPHADEGANISWAGGEVLVSFNASESKHVALELARFLVRPENVARLREAAPDLLPAAVGADTSAAWRSDPAVRALVRQLGTVRFTPNHPAWDRMEGALEEELEQALYDRKSAAQAVRDAQARLAALVGKR